MRDFNGLDCLICSISGDEKDEDQFLQSAPEIRDVFGDSDDEDQAEYKVQNQVEEDETVSPSRLQIYSTPLLYIYFLFCFVCIM